MSKSILFFLILFVNVLPAFASSVSIEGLDRFNVPYEAKEKVFRPRQTSQELQLLPRHASDNKTLEITLGPLTKEQFNQLVEQLGTSHPPAFQAQKKYRLTKFLPALIQVLDGLQFKPIQERYKWPEIPDKDLDDEEAGMIAADLRRFSDNELPLTTLTNCWTTAYEILRNWKNPWNKTEIDLAWISRSHVTLTLMGGVTTLLSGDALLKTGDLMTFSDYDSGPDMHIMQHVALYILPGLYFEKTDSSQDDAFRFVLGKDLREKFDSVLSSQARVEYYRLNENAKLPRLKDSLPIAAGESADIYARYLPMKDLKTITIQFDWASGMGGFSKPEFYPYRLHSVNLTEHRGRISLNPSSAVFKSFQSPDFL